MQIREVIERALTKALQGIGVAAETPVSLEYPGELAHGDYATGIALKYAKAAGKAPRDLAEEIVAMLGAIDGVAAIEIAGPGFINFTLAPSALADSIALAQKEDMWGSGTALAGQKVMVEYTDPNPFKEFHIGHLVPNGIGEAISRLMQFSGAEVKRANYQGDVGRHVARAIWGLIESGESASDVKALGRAYAAGATADSDHPAARAEITEINKKVYEKSDDKVNALYADGRKASLAQFEEIYQKLGTKFDYYFFESETGPIGKEVVLAHMADGVFEESDGATVYRGEKKNLHTRVFLNSGGLPTYEAKELGLSKLKHDKYPYDISVVVTGNEINEYFKVLLAAMGEVFPDLAAKTRHVSHGMMRLAEGKMSSRTGNVITGESLLADLAESAKARASESRAADHDELAQQIAVAAIKYQILKQASSKDIIFDRERALSLDGDSGPYLQYAYARTHAVLDKAKAEKVEAAVDANAEAIEVTRLLVRFPEVIAYTSRELEPHLLTNFLLDLASAFNSWYAQVHILDGTPEAPHKLAIVQAVNKTLKNGLWILGIPTPEKM